MRPRDDDLYARLPRGVLSDLGGWTRYQSFRTFTWPWWVRRCAVFWPLAIIAGCAFAAWHSLGMGAWNDWPELALRACLSAVSAVSIGPLLATIVRHRRMPLQAERAFVIIVILLGLLASFVALQWTGDYHASLMQGYPDRTMNVGLLGAFMSRFFHTSVDASVVVLVIAGGGPAIAYYVAERRSIAQFSARHQVEEMRAERDRADIRLAILQAQIEPHFLFNTLASVRSLIATEPERAARTIDAFADYLRATLPRFRGRTVDLTTLDRQLDICTRYLELMNLRMADRILISVDASEAARSAAFPPLVLLTLVENAVKHGVERLPGQRQITIRACITQPWLTVMVEDDGPGLGSSMTPGLGLANIRAQLGDRYGDNASLTVETPPTGGTCASVNVPFQAL